MTYMKLGEILIKEGLINNQQLQKAIDQQKSDKSRLGEILIRLGFITEEGLASALGQQLSIPYYSSDNTDLLKPQDGLETLIPVDFAQKNCIIPIAKNMNSLTCAVNDPTDLMLIDNLRMITNCEINIVIATQTAIQDAINSYYFGEKIAETESTPEEALKKEEQKKKDTQTKKEKAKKDSESGLSIDKIIAEAGEAPVIKLVDLIIKQAIEERASDIHIEPFENKIHLRYRIDGHLYDVPPPSSHLHLPIVSRIKILAKLDIAEKRLPQDGAISAKIGDRSVDIRISTIPTVWGEKVVMRILDKDAVPLNLTTLGFHQKQIDTIKKSLLMPYGLYYVTGPTGSGKSTSLYAAVNEVIDPTKNVVTVEDPCEYKISGINQVAVKQEIGLTFAVALKAFLRQDPDVIMVGETRDLETASICVRAALTGHFVLSTLHTNDAASAITRLMDIGIENYLLTPSLVLIQAQRLARKLCTKCKEPYESSPDLHGGIELNCDLAFKPKGCEACNNSGYRGRIVVAEVLPIDKDIRSLIAKKATYSEIKDAARKNGMDTIFESGLKLVEKGITSFDEICRVSVDFT